MQDEKGARIDMEKHHLEAAATSRAARIRWNQLRLGGRAQRLLASVDIFLGGYSKVEDQISNDQLMAAAGFRWRSDLIDARAEAVEKGCIVYAPSRGGRSAGGVGHAGTYAYCPEDIENGKAAAEAPAGESPAIQNTTQKKETQHA